jgi:phosphoribosylanthranilate isomerase
MPITQVKICGIRDLEIGKFCIDQGADYLGINISPISKRKVSTHQAIELINNLQIYSQTTKLILLIFKNSIQEIQTVLKNSSPNYIQYVMRDDTLNKDTLQLFNIPLIPQIGIKTEVEDQDLPKDELIILDSHHEKEGGGTGTTFVWEYVRKVKRKYFLAGGLNPKNVHLAVMELSPYGVDVASGVESSNGVKDKNLIKEFIKNAKYR